ncbi:MFS transporter [Andreprevotia chitinilytica]|uniref:MFS transporter n=1 Tax=Andreprevotia chitinilytica TaxID=396808 RepID=UPI000B2F55B6|nr:MFS transporter [Andreprevotia chitinilytica]
MTDLSLPLPVAPAQAGAMARDRKHRWKVLGIGVAANASFSAAFSGIPTTAVLMRTDYHLGNAQLGLAIGMLGLGIALSELPWGLLTDRWGDRRVLLTGLGATAAALALMALFAAPTATHVPSLLVLALGLMVVGLLGGSVNGSSGRAVMGWFQEGERGLAMSIRQTAVPTGGGIGALLLPALAAWHGFTAVYGVLALLCAVTALFAWRWLHEPPVAEVSAAPASAATPVAGGPLRDAHVWRVALGIGVLCAPQIAVLTFASVFLHDFSHVGLVAISATLAAVQVGAAIMRVWSGRWTDRNRNRRAYMRTCSVLSAILFAVLTGLVMIAANAPGWHAVITPIIIAILISGGICASAWHGVAFTELATLAGASRAGTALGLGNTCAFITLFLTPLAIPVLLAHGGWPAVWLLGVVCALIAWPLFPKAVPANPIQM